VIKKEAERF